MQAVFSLSLSDLIEANLLQEITSMWGCLNVFALCGWIYKYHVCQ